MTALPGDLFVALGLVEPGADTAARARALAVARAPVPVGLRAIHPTWIEHGLVGLPDRARAAVAGAPADPVDVWLARSATAHLPAMIVEPALAALVARHPAFVLVDGVPTAPVAVLLAWLDGIGADQLAFATGQAMPRLGEAPARIQRTPRKGQLGSQRAAIARCQGVALDELAHLRIAARALAPRVSTLGPKQHTASQSAGWQLGGWSLAAWQLAVRLPRPIGLVVHRELLAAIAAHAQAAAPTADAPTWSALLA